MSHPKLGDLDNALKSKAKAPTKALKQIYGYNIILIDMKFS